MKINVTQDDIDCGIIGNCELCPIALAILPIVSPLPVEVDNCCIEIGGVQYNSPNSVCQFIDDFDNGKPVKPFSFELEKIS